MRDYSRAHSFIVNGHRYDMRREQVESKLANVVPATIQTHAVRVNGTWFPVRQAFAAATGIAGTEFTSHAARRHLAALGFEVRGDIEHRQGLSPAVVEKPTSTASDEEWHHESNVQAAVVGALVLAGWKIAAVANTLTKERGIDIVAKRDGVTAGIEVKGFPSKGYADPARAHETKPTQPSTQAGHWFGAAVLAAMRLRGRNPEWMSVVALPDFPRYRRLHEETATSLAAAGIDVWWVHRDGSVSGDLQPSTP